MSQKEEDTETDYQQGYQREDLGPNGCGYCDHVPGGVCVSIGLEKDVVVWPC